MDKLPMASRAATYAAVTFWRSGIFCDHSGILCDQAAGSLPGKPFVLSAIVVSAALSEKGVKKVCTRDTL